MAASTQAYILLDTSNPPTTQYAVNAEGHVRMPRVYVDIDEALDGTVHKHILESAGAPVQREDIGHVLTVTHAELTTLLTLLGKTVYFVDNYHDPSDVASYVDAKIFRAVKSLKPFDPMLTYYSIQIVLEDAG
jgi:hypothetical protein